MKEGLDPNQHRIYEGRIEPNKHRIYEGRTRARQTQDL